MRYRILGVLLAMAGFALTSSSSKELRVLLSGQFLTLVGVLLVCGIADLAGLVRRELSGKKLESSAEGVIEKTQVTGTYINESPMVLMTIAFRDSKDALRHAQTKKVIQLVDLPKYAEGSPVSVKYKFDDPAREVTVQALPTPGAARNSALGV